MEFEKSEGRFYAQDADGKLLAEITFPTGEDGVADINHTFVDDSLRGQGVAGKLVKAAADELRAQGKQARTSCWYAAQWFERHPEEQDLLYQE
jgi:predicted GNAT family acetyltransferase